MFKAYVVGMYDDYDETWREYEIVAAESPEQAARVVLAGFDDGRIAAVLADDDDYSVEAIPDFDHLAADLGHLGLIRPTPEGYRNAGWAWDGEYSCILCGLYPYGMDKYRVCSECEQCAECGHDDDCPESPGAGTAEAIP